MATNGYDREEYRKQMEQLEQSMLGLGQNKGQDKGEQGKEFSVKSPGSSKEQFYETREYRFNESRYQSHEPRHPK